MESRYINPNSLPALYHSPVSNASNKDWFAVGCRVNMKYQTLSLVAGLLTSSLAADSCSMKHDSGFKNTHDDGVRTIDVSDQNGKVYNRKYGVYVPTDYNTQVSQGKKYPLIFDFHGRGSNAANQYDNSQYYKHTEVRT